MSGRTRTTNLDRAPVSRADLGRRGARRRAFTLTEMLVAVALLAVVILATSAIFGTAQRVASTGEGNADLTQMAAAIERQLRDDLSRLSTDGFLAIHNVSVNGTRADQLVFFANGTEISTQFVGSFTSGGDSGNQVPANARSTATRVYYGHGAQLQFQPISADPTVPLLLDPDRDFVIRPWAGSSDLPLTVWPNGDPYFNPQSSGREVSAVQPPQDEWILVRNAVLLADDDDTIADSDSSATLVDFRRFMNPRQLPASMGPNNYPNSAESIFSRAVVNGRVDIVATQFDDIRRDWFLPWETVIPASGRDTTSPILDRTRLMDVLIDAYPRAERVAPSMDRRDTMLSNLVFAGNCSSFRVEWTWADGVGRDESLGLPGVTHGGNAATPWFGLRDPARQVYPATDYARGIVAGTRVRLLPPIANQAAIGQGGGAYYAGGIQFPPGTSSVDGVPGQIEFLNASTPGVNARYGAFFGPNRDRPVLRDGDGTLVRDANGFPIFRDEIVQTGDDNFAYSTSYTPWPTAVRITMTLHDSKRAIEGGREFQFVIPLPKR